MFYGADVGGGGDDTMAAAAVSGPVGSGPVAPGPKRWRNPLPDDFLRVPGRGRAGAPGTPAGQMVGDEMVAQMFTDEMFMRQLAAHPEFAAFVGDDSYQGQDPLAAMYAQHASRPPGVRQRSTTEHRRSTGETFSKKMSKVGDDMKRKFNSFVLSFNRKRNTARPSRGGGYAEVDTDGAEEGASLLTGGDADTAGLRPRQMTTIDDDSDEEEEITLTRSRGKAD